MSVKLSRSQLADLIAKGIVPPDVAAPLRGKVRKARVKAMPMEYRPCYAGWPGVFTLKIDNWRPHSANDLKCIPEQQARYKAEDRKTVGQYAAALGIPLAISKRKLSIIISDKCAERFDLDAHLKVSYDCMVTNGLLIDDRPEWMEFQWPTVYKNGPKSTTFILSDLEPLWESP